MSKLLSLNTRQWVAIATAVVISVFVAALTFGAVTINTNVQVGDNTGATLTMDGDDMFINGTLEVDGVSNLGGAVTLPGSAGTTVFTVTAGDLVVSDGSLALTDADEAATLTVTNATATTFGAAADNGVVAFIGDGLTTGTLLHLSATEGTLAGGFYLKAWDETADATVFSVGEDGAVVIAGPGDGTDALTLTTGDLTISDGDLVVAGGDVNFTTDAGDTLNIAKGAAPTTDVVLIAGGSPATTAVDALAITLTTTDGTDLTNSGINLVLTSAGTAATDIARGIFVDLASTAGGTDTAIEIGTTAAFDVGVDLAGTKFELDADNDTSITADTDDQIDIEIAGADDFQFTANTFTALAGSSVTLADGDLTVSGGDFNVTLDADDGVNIAKGAAPTVDVFTIAGGSPATTAVDALAITLTTTDGTDLTNSGINLVLTSAGAEATDIARGIFVDLASTVGGLDTAIEIGTTAAWDVGVDLAGTKLDLDADNDTSITADTDDQIDIEIAGADDFQFTANTFTALAGSSLAIAGDDATLAFGAGTDVTMLWDTADADAHFFSIVTTGSNNVILNADDNTDWTHAASTNPTLWIQSADATTVADYISLSHNQTDASVVVGAGDLLLNIAGANLAPSANDGAALGISATAWSDLFLASGAVINFVEGDITLTHAANSLTFAGGDFTVDGGLGYKELTETVPVATDPAPTAAESGKTFWLTGGTGNAITIPAASNGVVFRFVVAQTFGTDYVFTAPADTVQGSFIEAGATGDTCAASTTITLEDGAETLGDFFELRSDGTNWFIGAHNFLLAVSVTCAG